MSRRNGLVTLAFVSLLAVGFGSSSVFAEKPEGEDWVQIFNGKNLEGWEQRNGTATYQVEDGCVLGTTAEGSPNSFLCSKKEYGNFELVFEVKVDDALNSGVQVRSKSKENKPEGRVHGPQVEIATNGSAGFVYGEALGGGWLSGPDDVEADSVKKSAFKKGEWNQYRVVASGEQIQTWVNGTQIVDFKDDKSKMPMGFIGLQVHGIDKGQGPFQVRWREIYLKELK